MTFENLNEEVRSYLTPYNCESIHKAYLYAQNAHESQFRKSGEPYIVHPLNVAYILAKQKMPTNVIIAGLLHDVVEDTNITLQEIEDIFDKDVASIVEGVTKLDSMPSLDSEQMIAENQRKVIIASAKDVRVIIVKLADRLHNMQTIKYMNENKQKRIAMETLDIYAPIAHRLGMYKIKWELEDLSFKVINKSGYDEIKDKINMKRSQRDQFVDNVIKEVNNLLEANHISAKVYGRTKHIYSIYQSMKRKHKTFEELNDLFGFRIVVDDIPTCYRVLGILHNTYKPIPLSFKDYIPTPKHNLYQSIHTTVYYGQQDEGQRIEFQIRTEQMDQVAEYGVASHWMYKEGVEESHDGQLVDLQLEQFRQAVNSLQERNSQDFVNSLQEDFFAQSIIVYTPKGDVVELPIGSSALDFAFYIHTNIGLHAINAEVNGQSVSLFYPLKMGDIVKIITSEIAEPDMSYLHRVKTHRAKESLRKYFNNVERNELQLQGAKALSELARELNIKELANRDHNSYLQNLAMQFDVYDVDDFLYEIGIGDIKVSKIKELLTNTTISDKPSELVLIENEANCEYLFCRRCVPIPGDNIIACPYGLDHKFIIHRYNCSHITHTHLEAHWTPTALTEVFELTFELELKDQTAALLSIINDISNLGFNIVKIFCKQELNNVCKGEITINLNHLDEFNKLKQTLKKNKYILGIKRKEHDT